MRKSLLVVMIAGLSGAVELGSAWAEATQPANLSCIVDEVQPHLQVLRDCENAYVPVKPPVEEIYLTPSDIPMIGPHEGGAKSDHAGNHDRPDHGGNAGGPNGAN